jgi:ribosomal protein L11 methyltransferase
MYGRIFSPFAVGNFSIIPERSLPRRAEASADNGEEGAFGSGERTTASAWKSWSACRNRGDALPRPRQRHGIPAIAAAASGAPGCGGRHRPGGGVSCAANVGLNGMADRVFPVCGELACIREKFRPAAGQHRRSPPGAGR